MKSIFIYLFCFFIGTINSFAQDFKFAQLDQNIKINNAASPGLIKQKAELILGYRSRWTKASPFRDLMISYDHKVKNFNIGTSIIQNDAGKASLKSTKVLLNFGYKKQLTESGDFIALGLNGGILQQRFQEQLFQFDNQYTEGSGYDSGVDNGEDFSNTNQALPVLNIGLVGKKYFNRLSITLGVSLNNINKPSTGFYTEQMESLPMETALFSKITIPWSERFEGNIFLAYQKHKFSNERIVGFQLNSKLTEANWIHFALSSRIGEAIVIESGYQYQQSTFILSYDIGNNMLSEIEGFKNVFELSFKNNF